MTRKLRAAIITPYGLFNYGNRLQNWAVNQVLRSRGYEVETLILRKKYPIPVLKDIALQVGHTLGVRGARSTRYQNFRAFDRAITKQRVWGRRHLTRLGRKYDVFVIGSDQIWNPHQVDFDGAEYGIMAPSDRVIALSASFGLDELPSERESATKAYLARLRAISVRESAGAAIVGNVAGREATVLIDPTLAVPAAVWEERASTRLVPSDPYVLVYMLGTKRSADEEAVERFAAARGCVVVRVFDQSQPEFYQAGPQDFLGLIRGARAFITDSYHGLVFSQLFGVECYVAERQGKTYSMLSRFDTIAEKLSIEWEVTDDLPFARRVVADSAVMARRLEDERELFEGYLDRTVPRA